MASQPSEHPDVVSPITAPTVPSLTKVTDDGAMPGVGGCVEPVMARSGAPERFFLGRWRGAGDVELLRLGRGVFVDDATTRSGLPPWLGSSDEIACGTTTAAAITTATPAAVLTAMMVLRRFARR